MAQALTEKHLQPCGGRILNLPVGTGQPKPSEARVPERQVAGLQASRARLWHIQKSLSLALISPESSLALSLLRGVNHSFHC